MRAIVTDFAVGIAGFRGPNNVGCRVTSCASRCRPSFDKLKMGINLSSNSSLSFFTFVAIIIQDAYL